MRKRYHINEEQVAELERERKKNKNKSIEKRLKALLLHAQGKKRAEIAIETGYAKSYISELVSKYCNKGISTIIDNHYPGNHRNLSFAEEEALLEPFIEAAKAGHIVDVKEIKRAYEEKIGRSIEKQRGLIYYVLQRHGWRKIMPRSTHPNKASEEDIEASKKLTQLSKMNW